MTVFITYKCKSYFTISSWNIKYSKKAWNSVTEASGSITSMTRTQMFQKLPSFFVGKSWAMCDTTTQNTEGMTLSPPLPPPVFSCPHPSADTLALSGAPPLHVLFVLQQKALFICITMPLPINLSIHSDAHRQRLAWAYMYSSSAQVQCSCFLSSNPNDIVLLGNHQSCSCLPWKLIITTSIPMFLYELFHRSQPARAQTTLHIICHVWCSFWRKPKSIIVNS